MSQAVRNERLAVRQKLIDIYKSEIEKIFAKMDSDLEEQAERSEKLLKERPLPDIFARIVNFRMKNNADGLIVYGSDGKCIYPTRWQGFKETPQLEPDFESAWQLEFADGDLENALKKYKDIEERTEDRVVIKRAQLAQVRVHKKKDDIDEAIAICVKARETGHGDKGEVAYLRANAQLMLVELRREKPLSDRENVIRYSLELMNLFSTIENYNTFSGVMLDIPSGQRIFLTKRAVKLYEQTKDILTLDIRNKVDAVQHLTAAESLSLDVSEKFQTSESFVKWPVHTLHRLPGTDVYATIYRVNGKTVLRLVRRDNIILSFSANLSFSGSKGKNVFSSDLDCRILDAQGTYIYGIENPTTKPFIKSEISRYLPGWSLELYFKDSNVLENAASKQTTIYVWTAVLVIVLILAAGGFAGQAVGRQIKLNRLKNDFIATVSHELKTPLSSMRVLADTLLEGNYKDQKQASEYLELICKENKRLSGLIDNFLTFSRMERNKQAFEMVKTSPAAIAHAAADAIKTKFSKSKCEFKVNIRENLPYVSADHDAIVTVLVNLLDNAYKYSYDEKHIELRVFTENNLVCFSVVDNGVGMSRRATKKIFNRFYQLDRSLSRRAGGCGLGLSIAKFIVDAHKGSISVDSKAGEGSTFTVELPAVN
jgi:signal transduction histidine kinase/tetratricopeptide (TPR) repeat protein